MQGTSCSHGFLPDLPILVCKGHNDTVLQSEWIDHHKHFLQIYGSRCKQDWFLLRLDCLICRYYTFSECLHVAFPQCVYVLSKGCQACLMKSCTPGRSCISTWPGERIALNSWWRRNSQAPVCQTL